MEIRPNWDGAQLFHNLMQISEETQISQLRSFADQFPYTPVLEAVQDGEIVGMASIHCDPEGCVVAPLKKTASSLLDPSVLDAFREYAKKYGMELTE